MDTTTRTPIVWDQNDAAAWLRNPLAETTRHRDAMTAQWPADMRIGYFHASTHMVPRDQPIQTDGYAPITALCGTTFHGLVLTGRVESTPCRLCTTAYNDGATTGIKPDPFPVGTVVEFDTRLGDQPSMMRGVVVERERGPQFESFRRVQVNPAGLCAEVRIENLTAVES